MEIVDYYSRFPEVRKLTGQSSRQVITALQHIFACHGLPIELITDNGPPFSCFEFARWAMTYDIKHIKSSPRYAQENGLVELCVQTIKTLLKKAAHSGDDFSMAFLADRSTPQETTGVAPAQLLMGRQ